MEHFEAILDVAQWHVRKSSGTAPFSSYDKRRLAPSVMELVRDFQDEGLSSDIALVRQGGQSSHRLRRLEELVASSFDAPRYYIYRGLRADGTALNMRNRLEEPTINSWSLFPGTALAIARARGAGDCVIVRDRLSPGSAAFYVDDYEHEIIRPALSVETRCMARSLVKLSGDDVMVAVCDVEKRLR